MGTSLEAVCGAIENDSTYGSIHRFLDGVAAAARACGSSTASAGCSTSAGMPVTILQQARNPRDIDWSASRVRLVVDTTGAFDDPTRSVDAPGGALRGHLAGGRREGDLQRRLQGPRAKGRSMPDDAVTLIHGINHDAFDPAATTWSRRRRARRPRSRTWSSRSSTGSAPTSVMTASMSTVHAVTNTQSVLDSVPGAGASDLRRSRSALNSIILTSTNAAATLEQVIPEIGSIGFMADSVRVPIPTVSLIILNMTFQTRLRANGESTITREVLNQTFAEEAAARRAAWSTARSRTCRPTSSGMRAAVVIEGVETHTRTGFVHVDLGSVPGLPRRGARRPVHAVLEVPVTHAKVFGWYDNEYGSYTNALGDLTVHVHANL